MERTKKSADLEDVFFPTELILNGDRAKIIGGMSDSEVGEAEIPNPLTLAA